jgi:hypothetical protein
MSVNKALGALAVTAGLAGAAQAQTFYARGNGFNGNGGQACLWLHVQQPLELSCRRGWRCNDGVQYQNNKSIVPLSLCRRVL